MTPYARNRFPRGVVSASVEPRWLADEMLGRLARYLRFMGFDAEYVRGRTDDEVRAWAERDGRTLLTRDRLLARRTPGAVGISATDIDGQLSELRRAFPSVQWEVRFERCTLCNGRLERWRPLAGVALPPEVHGDLLERGLDLHRCSRCHHFYWEGSHTRNLRARIARAPPASGA